jgi:formamidopyrimidine-DNA glycosylase
MPGMESGMQQKCRIFTSVVCEAGETCGTSPRCGAEMRHGTVGGRSTWWCSREQATLGEEGR